MPPPADKLVCADEPISPGSITVDYLTALRAAWSDCSSTVAWHRTYWGK